MLWPGRPGWCDYTADACAVSFYCVWVRGGAVIIKGGKAGTPLMPRPPEERTEYRKAWVCQCGETCTHLGKAEFVLLTPECCGQAMFTQLVSCKVLVYFEDVQCAACGDVYDRRECVLPPTQLDCPNCRKTLAAIATDMVNGLSKGLVALGKAAAGVFKASAEFNEAMKQLSPMSTTTTQRACYRVDAVAFAMKGMTCTKKQINMPRKTTRRTRKRKPRHARS